MRFGLHIHHDKLIEPLTYTLAERKSYILGYKARSEIETRFKYIKLLSKSDMDLLPDEIKEHIIAIREAYKVGGLWVPQFGLAVDALHESIELWYKDKCKSWHDKVCKPDCRFDWNKMEMIF